MEKYDVKPVVVGLLLALTVGLFRMLPLMEDVGSAGIVWLSFISTVSLFIYFSHRAYREFTALALRAQPDPEAARRNYQEASFQKKRLHDSLPAFLAEQHRDAKKIIHQLPPLCQSDAQKKYISSSILFARDEESLKLLLNQFKKKCPKQSRYGSSRELYLFGSLTSARNNFDVDAEALYAYLQEKKPDAEIFKQSTQSLSCAISRQLFHIPVAIKKEKSEAVWTALEKTHQTFDIASLVDHYAKCVELRKKPYHPCDSTHLFTEDMLYLDIGVASQMVALKIQLLELLIKKIEPQETKNTPFRKLIPTASAFG